MFAVAHLLTFTTYGSWLHGDSRGSHRRANGYQPPDERLLSYRRALMTQPPLLLCSASRAVVMRAIVSTCAVRAWRLEAAHVRPQHVHAVIGGTEEPAKVIGTLKAWSTRMLREAALVDVDRRVWTEKGSCVPLWNEQECSNAARYVYDGQGEPTERYP